ncbi:hypothetical protein FA95DRAFT_1598618 [Auriscalpium vulgare]|uniref:Uncharacterized protein n=1 Tax=Auriscalpium vulgare TaxID=40419 RepID=A0ACB8RES8_9AGAM|nr:hypothetical protein FA95DRAFT_1598618 [Auriscalpium vulgare]
MLVGIRSTHQQPSLDSSSSCSTQSRKSSGQSAVTMQTHISTPVAYSAQRYRAPVKSWSTIPPEIITMILRVLDLDDDPTNTQLVRATHVCRQWRAAALGCPGLWRIVPLTAGAAGHLRAAAFVARAALLPLDFQYCWTAIHLHRAWLELIAYTFPRLRYIQVTCTIAEDDIPILRDILDSPAPLLEVFHLGLGQAVALGGPLSDVGLVQAPRIRDVVMSGQSLLPILPWSARWHPNQLTSLHLKVETDIYGPNWQPQIHNIDVVLDCLKSLQGTLEDLIFANIRLDVPTQHLCRDVALPRLTELVMEGALDDIIYLLFHLDMNEGTFIDLQPEIQRGDSIQELFPLLCRKLQPITLLRCEFSQDHYGLEAYMSTSGEALVQVHLVGDIHSIPFTQAMERILAKGMVTV